MNEVVTSTRERIQLVKTLTQGGEGTVWITSKKGYLAKIYQNPTQERIDKLQIMLNYPPRDPNVHRNHVSFAWPLSLLEDSDGEKIGFLMPAIKGGRELLQVYNPRLRKQKQLEVDWRFLHVTALNVASIIQALHKAGYVLGDIKPQNILVNNRALPSIIDTDSFQVCDPDTGKVYRCPVASEDYTPVELLGKEITQVDQDEVQDRFRLGVIIHCLLFGDTPFKGKWIGSGESPQPPELIKQGWWPYAPNSLIQPSDLTIPLDVVHPKVKECFLRCFNEGHNNTQKRPTAGDWKNALKEAVQELTQCEKVNTHYYSVTYGNCYWCERSSKLGIDIFDYEFKSKNHKNLDNNKLSNNVTTHKNYQASPTIKSSSKNDIKIKSQSTIDIKDSDVLPYLFFPSVCLVIGVVVFNWNYLGWLGILWGIIVLFFGSFMGASKSFHTTRLGNIISSLFGTPLMGLYYIHLAEITSWGIFWFILTNIFWLCFINLITNDIHNFKYSLSLCTSIETFAIGKLDNTIELWNMNTQEKSKLRGHTNSVHAVDFCSDGKLIVSGSYDKSIKIWRVLDGKELASYKGHKDAILSVNFSPKGDLIASAGKDDIIKLWDVNKGQEIHTLNPYQGEIYSVTFSPKGDLIASAGKDDIIRLWDVFKGQEIHTLRGHQDDIFSVTFSPDGKLIASGGRDKNIKLWEVNKRQEICSFKEHEYEVKSIEFSSDGKQLISIDDQGKVKISNICYQ